MMRADFRGTVSVGLGCLSTRFGSCQLENICLPPALMIPSLRPGDLSTVVLPFKASLSLHDLVETNPPRLLFFQTRSS